MKKIARIALTLLLALVTVFFAACNTEEYNYLHENLDKSNLTNAEFTEWMYNRTKTSIKLSRPTSEIKYNVELLMSYYDYLEVYLDAKEKEALKTSDRSKHIDLYDQLSPVLVEYAKRVNEDKVWVGKTWRDTGRALNMTSNSEYMTLIANQIMARGKPVTEYYMYKEIARADVADGEEIVEVTVDYDNNPETESVADTVRVKFKDGEQALTIAKEFIQNAIYARPTSDIGQLYVLKCMKAFADFIGYEDAYVYEEEYLPGDGADGENEEGVEISRTKVDLTTYYANLYISYVE